MRTSTYFFAALSAATLIGCDSKSAVVSPEPANPLSINNSDSRKSSFQTTTNSDHAGLKSKCKAQFSLFGADTTANLNPLARTGAITPVVAVLSYDYAGMALSGGDFRVFMDTETDDNADQVVTGGVWDAINGTNGGGKLVTRGISIPNPSTAQTGIYGVSFTTNDHRGILLRFTPKTMATLPRLNSDYIVTRLTPTCPTNGIPFSQHFDNEDTDNQDWASRDLSPGWSSRLATGTTLGFCFVPKSPTPVTTTFVQTFGAGIGVFVNPASTESVKTERGYMRTYTLIVDGEDTDFAGEFRWEGMSAEYQARVQNIMIISSAAQTPFLSISNFNLTTGF